MRASALSSPSPARGPPAQLPVQRRQWPGGTSLRDRRCSDSDSCDSRPNVTAVIGTQAGKFKFHALHCKVTGTVRLRVAGVGELCQWFCSSLLRYLTVTLRLRSCASVCVISSLFVPACVVASASGFKFGGGGKPQPILEDKACLLNLAEQ